MKKMIEYWINPITHLKGGAQFELIFIATDEARMQVSIHRPMHEIVISYSLDNPKITLDNPKTFGEEFK